MPGRPWCRARPGSRRRFQRRQHAAQRTLVDEGVDPQPRAVDQINLDHTRPFIHRQARDGRTPRRWRGDNRGRSCLRLESGPVVSGPGEHADRHELGTVGDRRHCIRTCGRHARRWVSCFRRRRSQHPPPCEHEVGIQPMPPRDLGHRCTRADRLFDNPLLFLRRPRPARALAAANLSMWNLPAANRMQSQLLKPTR